VTAAGLTRRDRLWYSAHHAPIQVLARRIPSPWSRDVMTRSGDRRDGCCERRRDRVLPPVLEFSSQLGRNGIE
jgi:hypothetical protein